MIGIPFIVLAVLAVLGIIWFVWDTIETIDVLFESFKGFLLCFTFILGVIAFGAYCVGLVCLLWKGRPCLFGVSGFFLIGTIVFFIVRLIVFIIIESFKYAIFLHHSESSTLFKVLRILQWIFLIAFCCCHHWYARGVAFSDCTQIDETVFLTGIGGMTKENIRDLGITLIVNATFEAPNLRQEGLESLRICVDDVPTDDISQYFELAADKMNEHTTRGGKIIVHCVAGVSRSAALILAYLIKYKKMTLHDAFNMVREKRNVVRPNNGFFRQLIEFEKKYLGKASVKMINVEKEGTVIEVPDFFETEHPRMILVEAIKAKSKQIHQQAGGQPC